MSISAISLSSQPSDRAAEPAETQIRQKTAGSRASTQVIARPFGTGEENGAGTAQIELNAPDARALAENLNETLKEISDSVLGDRADLNFTVDDVTGKIVIKVVNRESGEVQRQVPPDEILQIARRLAETAEGAFLDSRA